MSELAPAFVLLWITLPCVYRIRLHVGALVDSVNYPLAAYKCRLGRIKLHVWYGYSGDLWSMTGFHTKLSNQYHGLKGMVNLGYQACQFVLYGFATTVQATTRSC